MGMLFIEYVLEEKVFACSKCMIVTASRDSVVSKDFHGRYGPAYLLAKGVNICFGPNEDRHLMTGWHTVNDIYCISCMQILGWRYERAYEDSQQYKEGKFILETTLVTKSNLQH